MTTSSDLEKLQTLLLGNGKAELANLRERIENVDSRSDDIAEALPEAILKTGNSVHFSTVLAEPVTEALQVSIKRAPETISNILFPVILPAIRKSIEHTLQSFMESIDLLVKQRFSLRSLKWRFESLRTGIPFTEIMLRHMLRYEAEQILLIQNRSGLLIEHVQAGGIKGKDSDAVSAMLTALEAFVTESFSDNEEDALDRVTIGDKVVYLEHGPYATLASVVRGVAPPEYRARLKQLNEEVHITHGEELQAFSGEQQELPFLRDTLLQGLEREYQEPSRRKKRISTRAKLKLILGLAAVLLLLMIGYFLSKRFETIRVKSVINALAESPGILIGRVIQDDDHWIVRGLRDPDATDPTVPLDREKLNGKVDLKLEPYLSLAPDITVRRARRILHIPATLGIKMNRSTLVLTGLAPIDWYLSLAVNRFLPTGVMGIDDSGVTFAAEDLQRLFEDTVKSNANVSVTGNDHGFKVSITGELTTSDRKSIDHLDKLLQGKIEILRSKVRQ